MHDPDMPCRTQCARQLGLPTCPYPRHNKSRFCMHAHPRRRRNWQRPQKKRFVAGRELLTSWAGERVEYYTAAGMQQRRQPGLIRLQPKGFNVVRL